MISSIVAIDDIKYVIISTRSPVCLSPSLVGRRRINSEQTPARFPEGTLGSIDELLEEGENRADFIRKAVASEMNRRRKGRAGKLPKSG
jgi:hypothetical protein